MRAQRPLFAGILLASITVVTWATLQMLGSREGTGLSDFGMNASSEGPSYLPQDNDVLKSSDDKSQKDTRAEDRWQKDRRQMVERQLATRDITDKRVLEAMRRVPRHLFVSRDYIPQAYADWPLPIGYNQTISQPYIVAIMSQLARTHPKAVALDIGTGSGYQAAVLSELCDKVYSIEIVEALAKSARTRLAELKYRNVTVRHGDGYRGWPEHAPFDVIIVAAAPEHIPQPLIDQLKVGGQLVIPVGKHYQHLLVIKKNQDGSVTQKRVIPVSFVPMTGEVLKSGKR